MRQAVPLKHACRLLNHGPTVLASSAHGGRRNVMAVAWNMPLDFAPPKVALVIDKSTLTRELIEASRVLVLNVPSVAQAALTTAVGSFGGREVDKFEQYGIAATPAGTIDAPLLDGCVAWLECRLLDEPGIAQRYDLFVAEVVAAWADDRAWRDGRWLQQDPALRTLHHISGGVYFVSGEIVDARAAGV